MSNPLKPISSSLSREALDEKWTSLREASENKITALTQHRIGAELREAEQAKLDEQNKSSWAGLDDGSTGFDTMNKLAGLAVGAGRLVGNTLANPYSANAGLMDARMTQADTDAYNRFTKGVASEADMKLLATKRMLSDNGAGVVNAKASMSPQGNAMSPLEMAAAAEANRGTARKINDFFDWSSIQNQQAKQELGTSLASKYQVGADQISAGWEAGKGGEYGKALKGIAGGVADLLVGAGEAAIENPSGVADYIVENAPQLLVGAAGVAGKATMAASNVGYAADYYQKGIENFKDENNGQLPSVEDRRAIAGWAASLALAEQLGDKIGLDAMGIGGTRAMSAGFKRSLAGTVGAATQGAVSEAVTEGYQTFAEGKAEGKEVTGADIYEGAVIGGLSGGAMSGGVRAIAEATKSTPEQVADKVTKVQKDALFAEAVETDKPELFLDKESKNYDPSSAIGVLIEQNRKEDVDQVTRIKNVQRAQAILNEMEDRKAELKAAVEGGDKKAKNELSELNKVLVTTDKSYEALYSEYSAASKANVKESINEANNGDVKSAEAVINLSMASMDSISPEEAAQLADNDAVSLTTEQRGFLRAFSEARIAENALRDMGKVSQEVLVGSAKNVGTTQYRQRIGAALEASNEAEATRQFGMLEAFAKDHAAKAVAARNALKQGMGTQIIKEDGNWKVVPKGTYSDGKLRTNGGLAINSATLVKEIATESMALTKTSAEMQQAMALRFTKGAVQSSVTAQETAAATSLPSEKSTKSEPLQEFSIAKNGKEEPILEVKLQGTVAASPQSSKKEENISAEKEGSGMIIEADSTASPSSQPSVPSLADARSDTVASSATAEEEDVLGLKDQKNKDTDYRKRNLVADFVKVDAGKDTGTQRPLAKVKDFVSKIAQDKSIISGFINTETTETQVAAITTFVEFNKAVEGLIKSNLVKGAVPSKEGKSRNNPEAYYKDPMQYLINEDADVAENVKTAIAYAAFSWVAENATKSPWNTPEEINAILMRDDDDQNPSDYEWQILGKVGTRESVVVNSMGQRAIAALGFKSTQDTPANLIPQLESAMGAHVLKVLFDAKIVQRNFVSGETMRDLMKKGVTNTDAEFRFITIVRNEADEINSHALKIKEAVKGTKGIVDKLFGVEAGLKEPEFAPIPFKQKTTRNTDQEVPKVLADIIKHENAQPNLLRQDMWQLMGQIDPQTFLNMAGWEEPTENTHKSRRDSLDAKNDGLKREYDRAMEFFGSMGDIDQPMYFEHSVWKQQRVGIATNVINPQTSKIHRHMLYRPTWNTKVELNDLENFKLRVAEGLGVKTDKVDKATALATYEEKVAKVTDAVEALRKGIFEGGLTAEDNKVIEKAVKFGGEKMHSLDALVALARMEQAVKEEKTSFDVALMGEVDGVTNGPMLSHLLLGAAGSVEQLYSLLNKGGFYQVGDSNNQYNVWRSQPNHFDLYETTTSHVLKELALANQPKELMSAIFAFTGDLGNETKVEKAGRDIIKTPLTAMVFGSAIDGAIDSMADKFIESIYGKIEKVKAMTDSALQEESRKQLITNLNILGLSVRNLGLDELMDNEFDKNEIVTLKKTFVDTIGVAVEATMKNDFAVFLEARTKLNQTAQLSFELYNAAYTAIRDEYIKELTEAGEIKLNVKGQPVHDLTAKQYKELDKRTAAIKPIAHTPLSKQSNQISAGLFAAKSARKLSERSMYSGTAQFGKAFKDNGSTSLAIKAYERVETNPGVGMAVMLTHSTDSAISHAGVTKSEVLNVHDAHGAGLGNFHTAARNLNEATFRNMLEYSSAASVRDMYLNVVRGVSGLMDNEAVVANVAKALEKFAEKGNDNPLSLVDTQAQMAVALAYIADDMKLQALEQLGAVDQYALEGGNYVVTEEDRKAASEARKKLTSELSDADKQVLDKFYAALNGKVKIKANPSKNGVTPSDKLTKALASKPVHTATEVAAILKQQNLTGFEDKLLSAMTKVLAKTNTVVKLVNKDTEVLEQAKVASNAWFVSKDGKNEIYISNASTEALLHEMVHATVAQTIANPDKDAEALVNELKSVMAQAATIINTDPKLKNLIPAINDVQEFVAYGMSNRQMQVVLKSINVEGKNQDNKWVNGLKKFVDSLVQLVFGKQNPSASTAMEVLLTNVAGLMNAAANTTKQTNINQSQVMTTTDIYEALAAAPLDSEFNEHLKDVLSTIVATVHGPMGTLSQATAQTPLDIWAEAQINGAVPFALEASTSGFAFTEQEQFVMDQVEASVRAVLDNKDGTTTAVYQELMRLYKEAKDTLTPAQFPAGLYDFVFKMDAGADKRSDHLSRFAALGLANKQFRDLLDFSTKVKGTDTTGMSMADKLHTWFERVMTWINGKLTQTYEGQKAAGKLDALVEQLVDIENKKRSKLIAVPSAMLTSVENGFRSAAEAMKANVAKAASHPFFAQASSGYLKAAGSITKLAAQDRLDYLMDEIQSHRDKHVQAKQGLLMATVNEVRGSTEKNSIFYKLLRAAKHNEGIRKEIMTNTTSFVMDSFKDGGKYLTKEMKAAVSAVVLRLDMASLLGAYNMKDLQKLVVNGNYLNQEVSKMEASLSGFQYAQAYKNLAKNLAYFKATGLVRGHLLMNAENIANLYGTVNAGQGDIAAAPIIDQLVSLYGLQYADANQKKLVSDVMTEEAQSTTSNGIEFALKMHQQLQQESKDRLFATAGTLQMKGYVPEVYNPYISMVVADDIEGAELVKRGYTKQPRSVEMDAADPQAKKGLHIYTLRDGGLPRYQTGTLSMTGMAAKGSKVHNGDLKFGSARGVQNNLMLDDIAQNKAQALQDIFTKDIDPMSVKGNQMAPVVNNAGDVVNWRYMMSEANKDVLLERENSFEHLLGNMAGSIFDKETTQSQNHTVIKALHDQYKQDFSRNAASYIKVGANGPDPEMREIWRLMPEVTKQSIRDIWGSNNMMVRYDQLDLNFGYRKNSVGQMFDLDPAERNKAQAMFVEFMEALLGKKAGLYMKRGEDIWQALVKEAKDILVVKSGITLAGNFMSNVSELVWFGVPMSDMIKYHRVALKGFMSYKKDSKELAELEVALKTGQLKGRTHADIKRRMVELNDSIARSPVKELIDAGMMPTIVEDMAAEDDQYSYQSKFTKGVDDFLGKIHEDVVTVGKYAFMTKDTPVYQVLSFGTQVSDFMARYTLYQHMMNQKNQTMSKDEALQLVSDAFVNYDVPSHRDLQYMNDMGLVYFSKYYLRIQKVIALLYKQSPGRALMLLTAGHFMDFLPMITHSAMLHRFGNPFSMGAFEAVGAVDELATVNALMSPFR